MSLSEQQLIDCSAHYLLQGCFGGSIALAYLFTKDNGAITSDSEYPYTGKIGECRSNVTEAARISGFKRVMNNEKALQQAIATQGPISAIMLVKGPLFHYSDGIYFQPNCTTSEYSHAFLIVGYGSDGPDLDYYWVKNSWGNIISNPHCSPVNYIYLQALIGESMVL